MAATNQSPISVSVTLSRYISDALQRKLPPQVTEKAKHHILDTFAAMVSGTTLLPGALAVRYGKSQGGKREATVAGSRLITSAVNAALVNGMLAHADETDDSHAPSLTHPGCAIIPAALAAAERQQCSGENFLRAVVLGYDIGCRTIMAAGTMELNRASRSTHSIGGLFGATAAAGAIFDLNEIQIRHLLSYAAQQASGVTSWIRDEEHVEKAFDFGGMPARNALAAATMVAQGFTGVEDALEGASGFFEAFAVSAAPSTLVKDLGEDFEILHANIKKWPVGSPIQAALDAFLELINEHRLTPDDVADIVVHLPDDLAHIVDNRDMPDISLQHMLALLLVDGSVTFANAHDYARMGDPTVMAVKRRVQLIPSAKLTDARPRRQAIVDVTTSDGRQLSRRTYAVKGTAENQMTRAEVEEKALDLMEQVLGKDRAKDVVDWTWDLERLQDMHKLGLLLQKPSLARKR